MRFLILENGVPIWREIVSVQYTNFELDKILYRRVVVVEPGWNRSRLDSQYGFWAGREVFKAGVKPTDIRMQVMDPTRKDLPESVIYPFPGPVKSFHFWNPIAILYKAIWCKENNHPDTDRWFDVFRTLKGATNE